MITKALFVRLDVKHKRDKETEAFLSSAIPLVQQEPGTNAWFAVRFGRSDYGIFDVFPDKVSRDLHLTGDVAKALVANDLFDNAPDIKEIEILGSKLPSNHLLPQPNTKGIFLTFKAKEGHELEVEKFLKDAESFAIDEEQTSAWFAFQMPGNIYGIFDVFPDNEARLRHLTGRIPTELIKHAFSLLGSFPDIDLFTVVAENYNTSAAIGVDAGTAESP